MSGEEAELALGLGFAPDRAEEELTLGPGSEQLQPLPGVGWVTGGSTRGRVIHVFTSVCVGVRISVFQVEPEFSFSRPGYWADLRVL